LKRQGDFAEALKALQQGHELGTRTPGWSYPSDAWVKHCAYLVTLDRKLPALLQGEPASAAEQLALADMCLRYKKRYRNAVSLFDKAFAGEPKLADDLPKAYRYNAACAAALAAAGKGSEALEEMDKAALRERARVWLHADLAVWQKQLEKEPEKAGPIVQRKMRLWQEDVDFAGLRGADALARLPDAEGQAWQQLWNEVETLVRRTAEPKN
jgi:hypothetical protein